MNKYLLQFGNVFTNPFIESTFTLNTFRFFYLLFLLEIVETFFKIQIHHNFCIDLIFLVYDGTCAYESIREHAFFLRQDKNLSKYTMYMKMMSILS